MLCPDGCALENSLSRDSVRSGLITRGSVPKLASRATGSGRGGPDPAFPLLFQVNPESRTFCRRFPESRFFFPQKFIYKRTNFCIS